MTLPLAVKGYTPLEIRIVEVGGQIEMGPGGAFGDAGIEKILKYY